MNELRMRKERKSSFTLSYILLDLFILPLSLTVIEHVRWHLSSSTFSDILIGLYSLILTNSEIIERYQSRREFTVEKVMRGIYGA